MNLGAFLKGTDRISRCLARTSAVAAAFVLAIAWTAGLLVAPRSYPTIPRTVIGYAEAFAGLTSLASIVVSLTAVTAFVGGKAWCHRTIHWYIVLDMVILLLVAMTPVM